MHEISIRDRECRTPMCPTIGLSSTPPLAGAPPFASRPFQHPVRSNVFGYTTRPDTMQSQFSEVKRDHSPHSLARVAFSPISRRDLVADVRLPGVGALQAYAAVADEPSFDP